MESTISPEELHNQNWLLVSSWLLAGFSFIFLALRFYVRLTYPPKRPGWDDYILLAAWVFLLAETIAVTYNVSLGYGRHFYNISPIKNLVMIARLGQVNIVCAILAAVLSKTSFAVTLLRLGGGMPYFKSAVWFIIITINIFMNMGIVLNYVQCTPVKKVWETWTLGECWPRQIVPTYNAAAAAYSGAADIALAALPWFIIVKLQMRLSEKIGTAIAMSCGVFAGVTAFVKTPYVLTLGNFDPIFDSPPLTVWGNAEIATTIIAASIPVLRVLARDAIRAVSAGSLGKRYLKGSSTGSARRGGPPAPDPGRPRSRRQQPVRRASDVESGFGDDDDESELVHWPKAPVSEHAHEVERRDTNEDQPDDGSLEMHMHGEK